MIQALLDQAPELEPKTPIDAAFSVGLEIWERVREDEVLPRRPSTYKRIENEVSRALEPDQRKFDVIQSIVDGSRFISEVPERTDLLNTYLFELGVDPELSLAQLRRMGFGLTTQNGDETVYSVARFLSAG